MCSKERTSLYAQIPLKILNWQVHLLQDLMPGTDYSLFLPQFISNTPDYQKLDFSMTEVMIQHHSTQFIKKSYNSSLMNCPNLILTDYTLKKMRESVIDPQKEAATQLLIKFYEQVISLGLDFTGSQVKKRSSSDKKSTFKTFSEFSIQLEKLSSTKYFDYQSDNLQEFELNSLTIVSQVLLFTLLSKSKIWLKLSKSLKNLKKSPLSFLVSWFRWFSRKQNSHIKSQTDIHIMDNKDVRKYISRIWKNMEKEQKQDIFESALKGDHQKVINMLMEGVDVDSQSKKRNDRTILHIAI